VNERQPDLVLELRRAIRGDGSWIKGDVIEFKQRLRLGILSPRNERFAARWLTGSL